MNRSELKRKARESLKGIYGKCIKLYLLYFLIAFGLSFVITMFIKIFEDNNFFALILSLIPSFIIIGLYAGFYSFFLKISRDEEVTCKELFKKNNLFWISIGVTLVVGIFTLLWSILFIIPGIIVALNYTMVYFVIVDNPNLSVMEVLDKSSEIMLGHRLQYLILNLSFLVWYILYFIILILLSLLGLDILYYFISIAFLLVIAPYLLVTTANFYNQIKDEV